MRGGQIFVFVAANNKLERIFSMIFECCNGNTLSYWVTVFSP